MWQTYKVPKAGHETRAERQTFNLSSEYNLIISHETQSIASIAKYTKQLLSYPFQVRIRRT